MSDALAPSATVVAFQKLVEGLTRHENVLVVGHNPNITAFLGALISGRTMHDMGITGNSSRPRIRLRKGSIARVDYSQRPGLLQWLVDPRILRGLSGKAAKSARRKTSRR